MQIIFVIAWRRRWICAACKRR